MKWNANRSDFDNRMKDMMENNGTIEGRLKKNGKVEKTLESSDIYII